VWLFYLHVHIKPHLMPQLKAYLPLKSKLFCVYAQFISGTYLAFSLEVKVGKTWLRMLFFPGKGFRGNRHNLPVFTYLNSFHLCCFCFYGGFLVYPFIGVERGNKNYFYRLLSAHFSRTLPSYSRRPGRRPSQSALGDVGR
jgi:hypothetical protein